MGGEFRFELSDAEKTFLKDLVRLSIGSYFGPRGGEPQPEPPTAKLKEHFGAFVTLKIRGRLRGCIGNVQGGRPLNQTIWDMARSAAFRDPRFPPLAEKEFKQLETEISILSPIEPCPDPEAVEIGRHGLIVQQGGRSGLLLPQVPVEWGWDAKKFLEQTCLKAGLPPTAWRDKSTSIFWFEAEVF